MFLHTFKFLMKIVAFWSRKHNLSDNSAFRCKRLRPEWQRIRGMHTVRGETYVTQIRRETGAAFPARLPYRVLVIPSTRAPALLLCQCHCWLAVKCLWDAPVHGKTPGPPRGTSYPRGGGHYTNTKSIHVRSIMSLTYSFTTSKQTTLTALYGDFSVG